MNKYRPSAGLFLAGSLFFLLVATALTVPAEARERPLTANVYNQTRLPAQAPGLEAGSLELLGQVGGRITSVVSDGEYLYASSGPRLLVLSPEPSPRLIGQTNLLPATVEGVAVSSQTAVLATGQGLYTVDVSNPATPLTLGHFPLGGFGGTLLAAGAKIYVRVDDEIWIVDVGDPLQPQLTGTVAAAGLWAETAFAVEDDLLAIGEECHEASCEHEYSVLLIDVSAPDQPNIVAELPFFWPVSAVALEDNLAHILVGQQLHVYDVSVPSQPSLLGSASLPLGANYVTGPAVADGIAYITVWDDYFGEGELLLYDLSDPSAPALLARLPIPIRGEALALAGNLVAVPGGCGLTMVDPANPPQPLAGTYVTVQPGGESGAMVADGEIIFSAGLGNCLTVLDVSDPAAPTLLNALDLDSPFNSLHKAGNLLYVGEPRRLSIFDVTTPASPALLSSVDTGFLQCLAFEFIAAGDYVYAHCIDSFPAGYPLILILDVGDPLAPHWAGEYRLPDLNDYYAVAATPGILYLVDTFVEGHDDVEGYIVDVRNPASPSLVATLPPASEGYLDDLVVDFPELYVYRSDDTLQIVDVLDPANPRRTATISAPGNLLAETDGLVYILAPSLLTVHARPPLTPFPFVAGVPWTVDWVSIPDAVAAAQQDRLFTGDPDSGLFVHRFSLPAYHGIFLPAVRR